MRRGRAAARWAWLLAAAALGPAWWAAPAGAAYFGRNEVPWARGEWAVVESDHFLVHFPAGLDSLALRVLDLAEKTDALFVRRLGHRPGRRVPIVLYGSQHAPSGSGARRGPGEAGTGGSTAVLRDRVVVPFTGSHEDLRHAVVHELAHVYLLEVLHGGPARRLLAACPLSSTPPWFAEGLAEHLSLGTGAEAETFLRDGIVQGDLPPLDRARGYLARQEGQSAVGYLVERHGEEGLRRLLHELRRTRGFDRAFRRALGLPVRRFEERWRDWLRRRHWPAAATRRGPERFARQLTDHRRDGSRLNTAPAVSPQGDRVAYFSDRRRYTDVCVMSAWDGSARRRVARGERGVRFEEGPSLRGAIAWSPDGRRLALARPAGGRDVLCVVAVADGRVLRRVELDCDGLSCPAWSPVGDSVVVTGLKDGQADLWLVDVGTGRQERLTRDAWDEKEPCWTPDGRRVTFASDRLSPIVLQPERVPGGFGRYGLFDLDLSERRITERPATAGDAHAPAWSPDGRRLAFLSDRGGGSDIMLLDTAGGTVTRLTEVLGGVSSLSWSRLDDRLVFAAFHRGGYDVFAVREPLSVDAVFERLRREVPQEPPGDGGAPRDTAWAPDGGRPFALPDSVLARAPSRCRARLAPDRATWGVLAATGFGFVGTGQVALGDPLGDRRVVLAADLLGRPLDETNALLVCSYLPRRWDLGAGLFHFRDYHSSRHETGAEALGSARIYAERSWGALLEASYPFDRSRRLDLDVSQVFMERTLYEEDEYGSVAVVGRRRESVTSPAVSLVGDNTLWGGTGPVGGGRYHLTFSPSFAWLEHGLAYRSVTLDARQYWGLTGGYVLAGRVLACRSDGRDAPDFQVGGFGTLRGLPLYGLAGTRALVVNAELRFPFVERLGVVGPVPLGGLALRGALFADGGLVWDRGVPLRFTRVVDGERRLDSPRLAFGAGVRTTALSLVLKLDAAWRTDLATVGRPRWEFSIGPEF